MYSVSSECQSCTRTCFVFVTFHFACDDDDDDEAEEKKFCLAFLMITINFLYTARSFVFIWCKCTV